MTDEEKIVKKIIDTKTLTKVNEQFINLQTIVNANEKDEAFRLFLTDAHTVNLERPIISSLEINSEEPAVVQQNDKYEKEIFYFKPLAVYTSSNDVIILREFESCYNMLVHQGLIYPDPKVKIFNILENAVIATFSIEMYKYACLKKDVKGIKLNGLDLDIFLTVDQEPQVWLDDKYGINHPIGVYFPDGSRTINSMKQTKEIFEQFCEMELLTLFKRNIPDNFNFDLSEI